MRAAGSGLRVCPRAAASPEEIVLRSIPSARSRPEQPEDGREEDKNHYERQEEGDNHETVHHPSKAAQAFRPGVSTRIGGILQLGQRDLDERTIGVADGQRAAQAELPAHSLSTIVLADSSLG